MTCEARNPYYLLKCELPVGHSGQHMQYQRPGLVVVRWGPLGPVPRVTHIKYGPPVRYGPPS